MTVEPIRFRVVVLGSSRVGKTALISRFFNNDFSDRYRETVEDLHSKQFLIKINVLVMDPLQGIPVVLELLDTNFNFPDMRRVAIGTADAFVIVFGVDAVQSFKEMADLWQEVVHRRADVRQLPFVVVGNKGDTDAKKIYEATAHAWTSRLSGKVRYVETSAKSGANVNKVFADLLELSGFPEGYDLPEPCSKPCSRNNSQKEKLKKIRESGEANDDSDEITELSNHISSGLTLPFDRIGILKRNHSVRVFQLTRPKPATDRPSADEPAPPARHKASIIRRTKHLSLKLHKSDAGKVAHQPANECGDCRVS